MAEWSKAVDSSIIEFFDGNIGFPTYPGFESQFYQIFLICAHVEIFIGF